ncbi:MAG: Gfo/Idh/MocA family oxidoreductase [Candidatus Nealsonbacteria bacterium]|nr:Gfo/Idh/MocA family oxidoreductase [Candidatus Nealsonbacteria bacterium]
MSRTTNTRWNRRQFLKTTAAGFAAVPLVVPSSVFGQDGSVAPSERISLGFIGVGMMGQGHERGFLGYEEAQVTAVCDVDRWRRENGKTVAEQTYAARRPGGNYRGCRTYNDLRELLARDDIDAVVIATGDNWHGAATVLAAEAGKDIYTEKPISKTIREARAMVEASRRYGRVAQIGLQQRSTAEFIKACDLVQAGRLGKVKIVYVTHAGTSADVNLPVEPVPDGLDWDLWLGPAPWRPFNGRFHRYGKPPHVVPWHFCRDFGGGNLTSNTVHAFDVVQWGLGMDESGPFEVVPPQTGDYPSLTYKYPDDVLLQVVAGKLDPQRHFIPKGWNANTGLQNFGALFVGEEGWIHVGRQGFLDGFPKGILASATEPESWHPVKNHHQNWLAAIKTREQPACDVAIGCRSTIVSHLGCIAHWTGRALKWDPVKEEFIGDAEANQLRRRPMRGPWRI